MVVALSISERLAKKFEYHQNDYRINQVCEGSCAENQEFYWMCGDKWTNNSMTESQNDLRNYKSDLRKLNWKLRKSEEKKK